MSGKISMLSGRALASLLGLGVIIIVVAGYLLLTAKSEIPAYNIDSTDLALHGYDTVAYFTEGKATKGSSEFEYRWQDARWHFASANNRDMFKANPDRFAPRFGGYCAAGIALGEYADVDPEAFTIHNGKLYMISTKENSAFWQKAMEGHIAYAEYNWDRNRAQFRDNR